MAESCGNSSLLPNLPKSKAKSKRKSSKTYVCPICSEAFSSLRNYKPHYQTHDSEQTKLLNAQSEAKLKRKVISEKLKVVAPAATSQSEANLKRKVISEKPKVVLPAAPYQCPNCPEFFYRSGTYRRHLLGHLGLPAYFCRDCLVCFMEKSVLISHHGQCHRTRRYTCKQCGKKFCHRHGLFAHKSEHIALPPFNCFKCPAVFLTATRLARHLAYHTLKCPLCLKPYNTHDALNEHLAKKHPDGDDCDFLSDHTDVESSDSEFSELDIGSDSDSWSDDDSSKHFASTSSKHPSAKITHVCFICERRFRKEVSLDKHMNSHKIFRCTICPMFFPKHSELKMHVQEHNRLIFDV